jgi:acyl carrier protein
MRAVVSESGERVYQAIAASLDVPADTLTPQARLIEELGAGEMELEQLALRLETTFDIEVLDADIPSLQTVQDVLDYVTARFHFVTTRFRLGGDDDDDDDES